jgi:hypothetical protein
MDALDRIEARQAIADLVHGYALAIRRGEKAGAVGLFTDDGIFEVREFDPLVPGSLAVRSRSEGIDAVAAYLARATGSVRMLPMIHNLIVTLADDGATATATSLMVGRQWPGGDETIGDYADSFRCEDGRWRFSTRSYTIYRSASG